MATAVFKCFDLKVDEFCRHQNCSKNRVKQRQQQILWHLFGERIDPSSYGGGQDQLTKDFREMVPRIFMFINNTLAASVFTKLLPEELPCLPSRMRILLTARRFDQTDMLLERDVSFEVELLSRWDLKKFSYDTALSSAKAFPLERIDMDKIVKICGGIPLVLE